MRTMISGFVDRLQNKEADDLLVRIIFEEMTARLTQKRNEGRGGWYTNACSNKELRQMIDEHLAKGEMIDVINLSAMIHCRTQLYGDKA